MKKITPFLWFDNNADEAVKFYTSVFKNSKLINVSHYGDAGPGPKGTIMTATIELEGQRLILLNGGPIFKFTEAISFSISCKDQDEVDYYWDKLIDGGGQPSQCGWLKDKFGLSWQVVPEILGELIGGNDPRRANNAVQAMLKMSKLDIRKLKEAYDR
jgi:predicted 3-demethylubiquinone-9 3-methyltransferase (glyoxalase superfamily)